MSNESTELQSRNGKMITVAVLVLAGAGGVIWAVTRGPNLEKDLTSGDVDRMRTALVNLDTDSLKTPEGQQTSKRTLDAMRNMPMEDAMRIWDSDDLSDEDRRHLGRNMRSIMEANFDRVITEYDAADTEEAKTAILDRQIDEFVEFQRKMREYWEKRREEQSDEETEEDAEQRRERMRSRWGNQTTADRRERAAEADPDRQAKRFQMMTKMFSRAQERGLQLFGGGPGGPGRSGGTGGKPGSGEDKGRDPRRDDKG